MVNEKKETIKSQVLKYKATGAKIATAIEKFPQFRPIYIKYIYKQEEKKKKDAE